MVPETSLWSHLLFESPWPAVGGLIGVWAVLRVLAARRQRIKLRVAAVVALGLAAGLAALAWAVTTDREQVAAQTEALVAATDPVDRGRLDKLIQPDAPVTIEAGPTLMVYRLMGPALDRLEVASQSTRQLDAGVAKAQEAVSEVKLLTRLNRPVAPQPVPSTWRFHWTADDQGAWRVSKIVLVEVNGQSVPDAVIGQLRSWLPTSDE
jgi:hypothetical protein